MAIEARLGLIDSGCSQAQAPWLLEARRFWLEDGLLREGEVQADSLGHGSAVLAALRAEAGEAPLLMAQVFTGQASTSALQVAAALLWLVEQGATLINLSLGLHQDRPVLRDACAAAQAAGVLLCASSPARGGPVYPASYPGVLRITGDARCTAGQWSWLGTAQADFGAPVGAAGQAGASLACATLSGRIFALLRAQPGLKHAALLAWLKDNAAYHGPERRGGHGQ
ncbi:S8 family serine peptidase [Pseudomonas entomophila]|uniref:subtilisin-like serine protease QhpE n=1 Tax=Pseudomonas entomophila TaxID=312306 RepID=UPI0023D89240|nr:S8 family serine peptidase [Pseudomonas entomophila]MDF0731767.1 S8 family serine peptidase [Pseudomonas entomophila]